MKPKTIALVGQPNAGKSTLFNVLSDIKSSTSNFSGTTVRLKETLINIFGETYHLIDLPGVYSLNPSDPAEIVTFNYLMYEDVELIINVVDANLLARSLELTVELLELGLPMVIALNMQDEAERHGVKIDNKLLSELLNIPVIPTTALFGKGVRQLVDKGYEVINYKKIQPVILEYTHHLEVDIKRLEEIIASEFSNYKGNPRFYAIKSIENPGLVPPALLRTVASLRDVVAENLTREHRKDAFETISYERHHLAMSLSHKISTLQPRKTRDKLEKIDDQLLHPVKGYLFMLLFFFIYFFLIFSFGNLISMAVEPPLRAIGPLYEPLKASNAFLWYTIDGAFQGLFGGLGIVLPYFIPLLFLTAIFEETGYLARIAFLLDGIFHRIGLHGKSVVPFIMGFGCTVPAIYATRIIENRRDRLVTALLLNFIPCSARISVIFALAAAFTGPFWAAVVFFFVVFVLAVVGKILSLTMAKPTGLILEIPTLKTPSLLIAAKKTNRKLSEFAKTAMPFLLAGSIVLGWIQYFHLTEYIDTAFSPVVSSLLGLPEKLGTTLIFGFLRKELIIVMASQALGQPLLAKLPLTQSQVVVFMIFITLYIPCLSTFVVFWKEFGARTVFLSTVLSIIVATVSALLFKIILSF